MKRTWLLSNKKGVYNAAMLACNAFLAEAVDINQTLGGNLVGSIWFSMLSVLIVPECYS